MRPVSPSTHSTAPMMRPSSTVVPRSGCSSTSTASTEEDRAAPGPAGDRCAGATRHAGVCARARRRATAGSASLAISVGWTTSGPNPSQRWTSRTARRRRGSARAAGRSPTRPASATPGGARRGGRGWRSARTPGCRASTQTSWRRKTPNGSPSSAASTKEAEKDMTRPRRVSTTMTTVSAVASRLHGPGSQRERSRASRPPRPGRSVVAVGALTPHLRTGSTTRRRTRPSPSHDADAGDDPEPHDDRGLLPPEQLEVVVDRRHAEQPLAGRAEHGDLQR